MAAQTMVEGDRTSGHAPAEDPVGHVLVVAAPGPGSDALVAIVEGAGYRCATADSAGAAHDLLDERFESALLRVETLDAETQLLLLQIQSMTCGPAVTVVAAGADHRLAHAVRRAGVFSYVVEPADGDELLIAMEGATARRRLVEENRSSREQFQQMVQSRTNQLWAAVTDLGARELELRESQEETIRRLSMAAELRDDETSRHIERMSRYCLVIARAADLDADACERLRLASQMHDVGKIGLPDGILSKTGPLTADERAVLEQHCEIGHKILSGSKSELLDLAAAIALTHHERVDGDGYPNRLAGDEIPLEARIAAIADVFDALTTDRPYRKAWDVDEALTIMRQERGKHFDEFLFDRFMHSLAEILELKEQFAD